MPLPTTSRTSRATCAACRSWRPRTTPASPLKRQKSLRTAGSPSGYRPSHNLMRGWRGRMSDPYARGRRSDASANVLAQARDERWRFDRFGFGAEVVAVITFAVGFPGCGLPEGSSARGAAEHSVRHSALRNVGRTANAASTSLVPGPWAFVARHAESGQAKSRPGESWTWQRRGEAVRRKLGGGGIKTNSPPGPRRAFRGLARP